MSRNLPTDSLFQTDHSRRRFVRGLALGGVLAGLIPAVGLAKGLSSFSSAGLRHSPSVLRGTTFDLDISETPVSFTGKNATGTIINGQIPAPTLYWREGETVTLNVTNRMNVSTSIHWHGMILPADMDGVPGLSYQGIAPGETFQYRFKVQQSGTFWYHSHTRFQEQTGLYGAIVIEPREAERFPSNREHVVVLSDWTDSDPEQVFANLKKMSSYYSRTEPTTPEIFKQAGMEGFAKAWKERMAWNRMRMSPRDLSDVTGYTYTYLTNGVTPEGNWTGLFQHGEKVRLRFVNASSMTYFDVRIPGLKMTVVAADGQDVEPVSIDEFRLSVAETMDVIVSPSDDRAYTIFAQAIDRSGYAAGTLAPRAGMHGDIPPMDPIPSLSMADMGMDMSKMTGLAAGGMDMGNMKGMSNSKTVKIPHHYATEYGPMNTKVTQIASTALDDPGAGLRDNGRRVLSYADLHTIGGPLDPREPTREIELHLTGNMERYMWSFNGVPYSEAKPILFHYGERLRIVLINDTMMNHPIHLHGMWSEVENAQGQFQVRKHTVNVLPAQRISYLVNADARGRWAYHCHMLYHMDAGMFRAVVVA
jgi:CopA family copper-resistance protein